MFQSSISIQPGIQDKESLCIHHGSGQACLLVDSVRLTTLLRQAESRQQATNILLEQSLEVFNADMAGIYDLQGDMLIFSAGKGLVDDPPTRLPANTSSILGRALDLGDILFFEAADAAREACDFCRFFNKLGLRSLLLIPLRTTLSVVSVLFVALKRSTSLTPSDHQLLSAFSEAAGNTLQRLQIMEQLTATVANRDRELHLIYDLMAIATETSEINQLQQACLKRVLSAVNCSVGFIHLVDPLDQKLKISVSEDFSEKFSNYLEVTRISRQLWTRVYLDQCMVQMHDIPDHRYSPEIPAFQGNTFSYLGVPIHTKGKVAGVLNLMGTSDWQLDTSICQLASSAADVLGSALESVRLHKQVEDAVILQERQRLARNLHDSVSQSLYALVISADVSEKLLRIKDYPGLRNELRDIAKVALQGLKEMRLLLNDFRPASLEMVGLAGALELRLNTVECRAGIDASLTIDENLKLSPQVEQEIYRVAIEALNNSLKHSEATRVVLSLRRDESNLLLEVFDNGLGFDPSNNRAEGGMGLASMHERARILGGELTVSSISGAGTTICLKAPLTRIRA